MKRKLTVILAGIALMLCMPLCTSAATEIDRDKAQRTEEFEAVAEEVAPVPGDAEEAPLAQSEQIDYESSEVTSGDFKYTTKTDSNGKITATITGFVGEESGDLVIPGKIDGYTVTEIGDRAFANLSNFSGILSIPNSVMCIGDQAFFNCNGFTGTLIIPEKLTYIGNNAFFRCNGFSGSLIVPDNVTYIGDGAFQECSGFSGNLVLPIGITAINDFSFYSCSGLTGKLSQNAIASCNSYQKRNNLQ